MSAGYCLKICLAKHLKLSLVLFILYSLKRIQYLGYNVYANTFRPIFFLSEV